MSPENLFLCHAFLTGFYFIFVYDILRVFRRVIPHNRFFLSLEDLGFWIYCATCVFLLMYRESNGTIRWFAVLGAMCGMLLYKKLFSSVFVKYMTFFLKRILKLWIRLLQILLKPAAAVCSAFIRRGRALARKRAVRQLKREQLKGKGQKKALTLHGKILKINLKGSVGHGSSEGQKDGKKTEGRIS